MHKIRIIPQLVMVTCTGPLATINRKLRQARKGATVAVTSGAGVWLVWVTTQALTSINLCSFQLNTPFKSIKATNSRLARAKLGIFLFDLKYINIS